MIDIGHPYFFLEPMIRSDLVFTFSRYVYTPDSLSDEREVFDVQGSDLSADWVNDQIETLRPNQELAIHSNVRRGRRIRHFPMIDFSISEQFGEDAFNRLRRYLPVRILSSLAFFRSGRSYHAYGKILIPPVEWVDLMGRLLLVNPRGGDEIVDVRWIGHRILSGFGTLRFSNNSGAYLAMPAEVGPRELVGKRFQYN